MRPLIVLSLLTGCEYGWDDSGDAGAEMASLADIVDLSVNQASAGLASDGDGLQLRAEAGDNDAGGFNGSGTGNKSIAGLPGYDGLALSEFVGVACETRLVAGTWSPYWNLVLDLDGTGSTLKIIVASSSSDGAPEDLGGDVWRYAFAAHEAQWSAVGGLDDLLPSHLAGETGSLTDVLAVYPDAVLRDATTGDNGMPAGVETTALMLIVGDSLNTSEAEQRVTAIEVNGERFEGP